MVFGRKKKEADQALKRMNPLAVLSKDAQGEFATTLAPDESIDIVIPGEWEAALVATSKRVYIFKKGMMGGVMRGTRMSTWEYQAINGVTAEYGKSTGWIALQTMGASVSDMSRWGSGEHDPAKLPNAITIVSRHYPQIKPAVIKLQDFVSQRQSGISVPRSTEVSRTCPTCRTRIAIDTAFCPSCGTKMSQSPASETSTQTITCPRCGKEGLPTSIRFCPNCGLQRTVEPTN